MSERAIGMSRGRQRKKRMLSGKRKRRNGGRTCFRLGLPLGFDGVERPEDALDSCGDEGEDEAVDEVMSDEGGGR